MWGKSQLEDVVAARITAEYSRVVKAVKDNGVEDRALDEISDASGILCSTDQSGQVAASCLMYAGQEDCFGWEIHSDLM